MAEGRLYVVEDADSMTIVRAVSEGRALTHVVKSAYKVRKATPDDVELYMGQGGQIENATIATPTTGGDQGGEGGEGGAGEAGGDQAAEG